MKKKIFEITAINNIFKIFYRIQLQIKNLISFIDNLICGIILLDIRQNCNFFNWFFFDLIFLFFRFDLFLPNTKFSPNKKIIFIKKKKKKKSLQNFMPIISNL